MKAKRGDRIIYTQHTTKDILNWTSNVRNSLRGYLGSSFEEGQFLFQIKLSALKSDLIKELLT